MALSSSNASRQLSDGNSQGTVFGQGTSDSIGFYGIQQNTTVAGGPQIQQQLSIIGSTLTASGAFATTLAVANSTMSSGPTTWAFGSSTQANMVISTMAALWRMGLIG